MTSALYRKYRPQMFQEVVGQDHVTRTLKQEIVNAKLAHAYLFCGMRGVGKTTVARVLAKAVNCERRQAKASEPCNNCQSCQAIISGRSLDLIEIDAASNRRIDDIREIREHIPYGPTKSKYKVVIVDEVHMLTTEAFNALLKTLEEPPPHVIFVLCTTEVHKLPETIISRCQRFDFARLTPAVLLSRLRGIAQQEGLKIEPSVLKQIIDLADGSSRDAEGYLGKLVALGEEHITAPKAALVLPYSDLSQALDFVGYLINRQGKEAVSLIDSFMAQGGEVAYWYRQILELMRQLLWLKLSANASGTLTTAGEPSHDRLLELSRNLTLGRLQKMIERWLTIEGSWKSSEIWQLPLELAAVEIAYEGGNEPEALAEAANSHQTEVKKAESTSGSKTVSLEQITERWSEVVASLRDYNHSLSFILSVARPVKIEGDTLTIGFSYQLHLERVKDPKVMTVIEQALAKVFGQGWRFQGVATAAPTTAQGDLLAEVLTTFGGKVVE